MERRLTIVKKFEMERIPQKTGKSPEYQVSSSINLCLSGKASVRTAITVKPIAHGETQIQAKNLAKRILG